MTATRNPGRFWKLFRIYFRRCRISVWLVILAMLAALLYFNQIGLPDFVKKPLLAKLRVRGLDLQFTRLRLRFPHGLVAENVMFGSATAASSPVLTLKEIQVRLDYRALLKRQLQVKALLLRQGRLVWPIAGSNQPSRELTVENIQTELRFLPDDVWELDRFQARFSGVNIQLAGTVTNASVIRDWKIFQPHPVAGPPAGEVAKTNLRRLADVLDQIHFRSAPELKLEIDGDARRPADFGARATLRAAGAETAWGSFDAVDFSARVQPPQNLEPSHAEIILRAGSVRTPWATADALDLTAHVLSDAATNFNADLNLTAARVETGWGNGGKARFTAQWRHSATNAVPLSGHGRLELEEAQTPWGSGRGLELNAVLSTLNEPPVLDMSGWGFWKNLAPYSMELTGRLNSFQSAQGVATNLVWSADWRAPQLTVKEISADIYDGRVHAQAALDVDAHEVDFEATSDCNLQNFPAVVNFTSHSWLTELSFGKPPQLNLAGQFLVPSWTNQNPDWVAETKSSLKLLGQVSATRLTLREIPFASADFHFTLTNAVWRTSDLRLTRPEGSLETSLEYHEASRDFFARIHSTLDANVARALVDRKNQGAFDLAEFTEPPEVAAEIRGRGPQLEGLDVKGRATLTNFAFRGQTASGFQSAIQFTNNILTLDEPRIQRGEEHLGAGRVTVNFDAEKIYITNGFGTGNPLPVARAIGPVAGQWFEPYHFSGMPSARVNGSIAFDIDNGVDLHFDFQGGPFEWWLFKVPQITGQVNWVNDSLTLKDIHADFYQGSAQGEAEFTFPPGPGVGLRFAVAVTNADLHSLLNDLNPHTNRLAGLLSGYWNITQGNAPDIATWQGRGHVNLRDGRIMEIPVFGVLSPALDNIAPGLGSNRLSEGTADFGMLNGIIHTDDLDIRASGMRLVYRGDVNLAGRVNARAEAELLRDTWMVGKVLSLALWPVSKVFEYKISGSLSEPKMEPLYFLPRLILMPLHPIESMKELMLKAPEAAGTNAPSAVTP